MVLDLTHYDKCISALQAAFEGFDKVGEEEVMKDIYRSACVKEFEIILELTASLLRKALKNYVVHTAEVDRLHYKEVLRRALKYGMLDADACERWMEYRDIRNNAAPRYGKGYADETLAVIPEFLGEAIALSSTLKKETNKG